MVINLNGTEYIVSMETYDKIIDLIKDEGPIRRYVSEHPILKNSAFAQVKIITFKGNNLVVVPLPKSNTEWTLEAFDYIKELIALGDGTHDFPVHGCYTPQDSDALYFKFED